MTSNLHDDVCIFIVLLRWILWGWVIFKKIYFLFSVTFSENVTACEIMRRDMEEKESPQMTIHGACAFLDV